MNKIVVDKEKLIELYINQNLSISDVATFLGISYRTTQRAIKEFNLNKNQEQISNQRKLLLNRKYGVNNVFELDSSKTKIKQTKLDKYGDENYNNCKKHTDTLFDKYGVTSPALLQKSKDTLYNNYKVTSPMKSDKIKNRVVKTNLDRYGVPWFNLTESFIKSNGKTISKINIKVSESLKDNGINNEFEFIIDTKSYDLHILDTNILIEINPSYTHNSTIGPKFSKHIKDPLLYNYHFNKTKLASDNGYRCIHIWDWDDIDKIINMLKPKQKMYARKLIIKEVDIKETNEFLNTNHLQGTCRGQVIRLGLYTENNELIQVMTFGKPRYNKNYEYELLRLCTDNKYIVIGGANRLFNYFIKLYQPENIISYCDNSKFSGDIYYNLGFELKSYGSPSKHWYNGKEHITDNLLRQRGFDQLFNTNYGKGTSNEELMIQHGFVEIYDCGQSIFTYQKN